MKISELKRITGKFFGRRRGSPKVQEINPRRDWSIALGFFVFIALSIIAFSSYMYWRINSGSFFVTSGGKKLFVETIDRAELKNIIRHYENKDRLFQEIKNTRPQVVDPSL